MYQSEEEGIVTGDRNYPPAEGEIDYVTLEVLRKRLTGITEEMGFFLERSASSEMIKTMRDFSTGLFTADGRLLAQGEFTPGLLGPMPMFMRKILDDYYPVEKWEPEDVVTTNDPYLGAGHYPDFYTASPIFFDDELVGFAAAVGHHKDVGGVGVTGFTMEVSDMYVEGVHVPPTKLVKGGEMDEELMRTIQSNSRTPETIKSDLIAQYSTTRRGVDQYTEIIEDYGLETVRRYQDEILHRDEKRTRESISEIPDGTYPYAQEVDVFDFPLEMTVEVTIDGDDIIIDWSGSSEQLENYAVNATLNYTFAHSIFPVKSIIDPDTPQNDGSLQPITLKVPHGTILNPEPPVPLGSRSVLSNRCTSAINGALAQAVPERTAASGSEKVIQTFRFVDNESGDQAVILDLVFGGGGAQSDEDGNPASPGAANIQNMPVEIMEFEFPIQVNQYQIAPDTAGDGRHRGGSGTYREFEFKRDVVIQCLHGKFRIGPYGVEGGDSGKPGQDVLNPGTEEEQLLDPSSNVVAEEGDVLRVRTPGGGGYGSPAERETEAVRRDVENGVISAGAARDVYNVDVQERNIER